MTMSVAVSGPSFLTVKVHSTISPKLGLVLLTSFVTFKSAAFGTLIVASALLLVSSVSGSIPVTIAVFTIVPVVSTLVTIFKVSDWPFAKSPISQAPIT